jgi:hypothetical protein
MALLAHRPDRYLRAPQLVADARGVTLYAIGVGRREEALLAFEVTRDERGAPALGEPRALATQPVVVALTRGEAPQPSDDAAEWDRARDGEASVWLERADGRTAVRCRLGAREVTVWSAFGTAAAPTVVEAPGGAWVAFHHNVREDTGEPDLTKWIALRFVTADGEVREPAAPMRERDRDREGEEQGFEFPSLVVGPDGALALFGRGSHAFFRQDVGAAEERVEIGRAHV